MPRIKDSEDCRRLHRGQLIFQIRHWKVVLNLENVIEPDVNYELKQAVWFRN